MRKYETVFVIRPELEDDKYTEVIDKFTGIITDTGGEITNIDKWGKKRLAYEINHVKEGFYVVVKFNANKDTVEELDRVYKISDDIIRHIIVREDD